MAKLLKPSRIEESKSYSLSFTYADDPQSGFQFPCDKNGKVDLSKLTVCSRANYEKCLSNSHSRPVVCEGVVEFTNRYRVPAELECDCNRIVHLSCPMTNVCECGRLYNGSGQALAPTSQWGEETGERFDQRGQLIR